MRHAGPASGGGICRLGGAPQLKTLTVIYRRVRAETFQSPSSPRPGSQDSRGHGTSAHQEPGQGEAGDGELMSEADTDTRAELIVLERAVERREREEIETSSYDRAKICLRMLCVCVCVCACFV